MAQIVSLPAPHRKIDALIEGDRYLMEAVSEWRIAKAKADLFWAERPQEPIDHQAEGKRISGLFEPSQGALDTLAGDGAEPSTAQPAHAMLKVALDLMAIRMLDPDGAFSRGPAFEIVRNVRDGLNNLGFEALWFSGQTGSAA